MCSKFDYIPANRCVCLWGTNRGQRLSENFLFFLTLAVLNCAWGQISLCSNESCGMNVTDNKTAVIFRSKSDFSTKAAGLFFFASLSRKSINAAIRWNAHTIKGSYCSKRFGDDWCPSGNGSNTCRCHQRFLLDLKPEKIDTNPSEHEQK